MFFYHLLPIRFLIQYVFGVTYSRSVPFVGCLSPEIQVLQCIPFEIFMSVSVINITSMCFLIKTRLYGFCVRGVGWPATKTENFTYLPERVYFHQPTLELLHLCFPFHTPPPITMRQTSNRWDLELSNIGTVNHDNILGECHFFRPPKVSEVPDFDDFLEFIRSWSMIISMKLGDSSVWPICLNNFHPDTNRLQLWFMFCVQQIFVLLLDGICPNFSGVIKTQPAEFHKSFNKFDLPPKWVLCTDPCFTRYKKSLSDSQRAPSTPQHPTAKNTNTHTHTLFDGSLETSEGAKPWGLQGYLQWFQKSEYNMGVVKSLVHSSKRIDWWYSIIEDISITT